MTIGFTVRCVGCGTDSPDRIYYVGETETHCGDCWSVLFKKLINAQVNFNTDAKSAQITEELKNSGPLAAVRNRAIAKVEPLSSHFEPSFNSGSDRP